ncbi:hypothetical protein B6S44_19435 [Bosea sp. Tri-44]|nr:hypothetical protein B6S44_19435 [Bosea sp. Tri-44]
MGRGATTSFLRRGAYSFALDGELRAMPAEQLFAQYLPRRAFHIVQGAKTLGSIDLLPWQDGGVVMLRGPFPLEALLALLEVSQEGGRRVTRRPGDLQLSQVLPLQHDGFVSLLKRFEQRSNMRVTIVEPTFEKRLVSNEGTSSPYVARLFLGLLHLRGSAIQDEHKTNEFDAIFHGLTTAVTDLRDAARALTETWSSLQSSVANGVGVRMEGTTLQVEHLADRDLNRICADFLRAAVNVIKVSLQELAKCLGTDIGFWFKKEEAFLAGVEALAKDDPGLAAYLVAARCSWSEQVVDRRNAVDHHSWRLPLATYQRTEGQIEVIAPEIEGEPVLSYVDRQLNRICCAVEEITAHLLANLLPEGLTLHETPVENRDENSPIRFELTLETGGKTIWALHHHSRPFLES